MTSAGFSSRPSTPDAGAPPACQPQRQHQEACQYQHIPQQVRGVAAADRHPKAVDEVAHRQAPVQWSWLAVQLAPQVLEPAQRLWGWSCKPAPTLRCPVQDRPDQAEAAPLTRQAADHLDPAAGLAEGRLDQVGVPVGFAVLGREQQVGTEASRLSWETYETYR
jgi:hypothetical protein